MSAESKDVTLAITASGRALSCGLRVGEGPVAVATSSGDSRTRADVAATVAALFDSHGVSRDRLACVLLDVGPGSYTGLRMAVTFARFLASFGGASLSTVTSLELCALAWRSRHENADRALRPILDARRGRFHTLRIEPGSRVRTTERPRAVTLEALREIVREDEIMLADAATAEVLRAGLELDDARIDALVSFDARDLFDARLEPRPTAAADLEPLYLMGSYAEPE